MLNEIAKTKKIMNNVMAALNTYGIEYDTNISCCRRLEKDPENLKKEVETWDYESGEFEEKFKEFAKEDSHYQGVQGSCWADDGKYVIIQFERLYIRDEQDWEEWLAVTGYNDIYEASINYGDPEASYIFINARVKKGDIDGFVRQYAKDCW